MNVIKKGKYVLIFFEDKICLACLIRIPVQLCDYYRFADGVNLRCARYAMLIITE